MVFIIGIIWRIWQFWFLVGVCLNNNKRQRRRKLKNNQFKSFIFENGSKQKEKNKKHTRWLFLIFIWGLKWAKVNACWSFCQEFLSASWFFWAMFLKALILKNSKKAIGSFWLKSENFPKTKKIRWIEGNHDKDLIKIFAVFTGAKVYSSYSWRYNGKKYLCHSWPPVWQFPY